MKLQKYGAYAALFETGAFIFGFALFAIVLEPARYGAASVAAAEHVAFLSDHRALMSVFNLVIYIAFGAVLVVLSLALNERMRAGAPALANVAAAFGLIWAALVIASGMVANIGMGVLVELLRSDPAQLASVWPAYKLVVNGLGGGNEIVGGLWVLLVSIAGWQTRALPKPLNALGIVVGVSGLVTTASPLEMLGAIFGLGLILWFAWLGVAMLRTEASEAIWRTA